VLAHIILFWGLPLLVFAQPTPPSEEDVAPSVEFSHEGGFYEQELELRLVAPGASIYYTLNGSKPDQKSKLYRGSISITSTTVLRAVAYRNRERGPTTGHTFFIREPASTFPVISIAIPSWVLFDRERGLFMQGSRAVDTIESMPGANFWSRKEVLINAEIFETDGSCVYRNETGMRLFGGMSRLFPQKSLAIVARKRYGQKRIEHAIFGEDEPDEFKFLVLRNSGSDWGKSHFRDGFMTGLLEDWDLDKQAFRPAHIYVNGDYWGIYNIREKVNRYFIAEHHDVDKDSLDLIEHYMSLKRGSRRHYKHLLDYLESHDLSNPSNFAYVKSLMEVENFMDFQIAQIFFDNQDAGGNIKFWRPQTLTGRWRWIIYDTDWGFGLHEPTAYRNNSLAFHTEPAGPSWPNPPWSTFILRKLLENDEFRTAFALRFADHLNTTFRSGRMLDHIEKHYQELLPEITRHFQRWRLKRSDWEEQVDIMRSFARKRPGYIWRHLDAFFDAGALRGLQVSATGGGTVVLNKHLHIRSGNPLDGQYFQEIPVSVKAIPDHGYRFSHWEGIDMEENLRELRLPLTRSQIRIHAVFEKFTHPLAGKVIINEISLNNKKAGDWIEFFNYSDQRISLKNWIFTDSKHEFFFPDVSIGPNDYLVLVEDSLDFREVFPNAYNVLSGMDFGINKRHEILGLYASFNAAVDSVSYDIPPTDSTYTLNLLLPHLDNSDLDNWEVRWGPGSPNAANPYYVQSSIRRIQEQWVQMGLATGVVILCILLLVLRRRGIF